MNRRSFLKTSLLSGIAACFAPKILFSKSEPSVKNNSTKGIDVGHGIVVPKTLIDTANHIEKTKAYFKQHVSSSEIVSRFGMTDTNTPNHKVVVQWILREETGSVLKTPSRISNLTGTIDLNMLSISEYKHKESAAHIFLIWAYIKFHLIQQGEYSDFLADQLTLNYWIKSKKNTEHFAMTYLNLFGFTTGNATRDRYNNVLKNIMLSEKWSQPKKQ